MGLCVDIRTKSEVLINNVIIYNVDIEGLRIRTDSLSVVKFTKYSHLYQNISRIFSDEKFEKLRHRS